MKALLVGLTMLIASASSGLAGWAKGDDFATQALCLEEKDIKVHAAIFEGEGSGIMSPEVWKALDSCFLVPQGVYGSLVRKIGSSFPDKTDGRSTSVWEGKMSDGTSVYIIMDDDDGKAGYRI